MRWLALLLLLATNQVFAAEKLGRGLVAIECERGVFLSWRLLATDPENVRFRIFRREGDSSWKLITEYVRKVFLHAWKEAINKPLPRPTT
jgi:hypothetical protein